MKAVIQRVKSASVTIDDTIVGSISQGFMILLGIHEEDTKEDVDYLVRKTVSYTHLTLPTTSRV